MRLTNYQVVAVIVVIVVVAVVLVVVGPLYCDSASTRNDCATSLGMKQLIPYFRKGVGAGF